VKWGNGLIAKRMADLNPKHWYKVYGSRSKHMLFIDFRSWFPEFIWSQIKKLNLQGEDSDELTKRYVTDIIKWLKMITITGQSRL